MKKLLVALLALVMVFAMAVPAMAEFAPVAKEDLKVGFVYVGDTVDKGYTYAHHQGTLYMMDKLGLSEDQVIVKTNVSEDAACEEALRELVDQGCQIIFGNSYGFMDYMEEMAEEYPEVIFSHCSGYKNNGTNFNNYFGAIYQARYLSGIAAGLKTKSNKIGFVAAMPTPEVIGGFDAFALGVQSVNPDAIVYVKYTNTWYDANLERQTADALLDMGCDVIGQHCDTSMPSIAAQERGAFSVGYNADASADAPDAFITAPVWNWGIIVTEEVQAVIDGTWKCDNIFPMYESGVVGLAPPTKNAADGTAEAIAAAEAKILGGWDVFTGPIYDNNGEIIVAEGSVMDVAGVTSITAIVKGVEVQ